MTHENLHEAPRFDQYDGLDNRSLVRGYTTGEVPGEAIMGRLLAKVGMGERATEPLMRADGSVLTDEQGNTVRAVDYLSIAKKHQGAEPFLLLVTALPASDPRYIEREPTLVAMLNNYLPPQRSQGA